MSEIRTSCLEQSADGPQTVRLVMQPFQTVAGDIFWWMGSNWQCLSCILQRFRNRL